jgi:hypothetical protein
MQATPQALAAIRQLRATKKFLPENLYPGAPDEQIRTRCEAAVNRYLDETLLLLNRDASRDEIFARTKRMLDDFADEDTEEREQADTYIGEAMRALGIDDWTDFV